MKKLINAPEDVLDVISAGRFRQARDSVDPESWRKRGPVTIE